MRGRKGELARSGGLLYDLRAARQYGIACGQIDIGNATETSKPDGFAQRPQPWRPDEEVRPHS